MKSRILTLLFIICTQCVSAQIFEAKVSHDTILMGNQIEVSFNIENLSGEFEPPIFNGFAIIGGPNINSSYQYMNGDFKRSQVYSYILKPLHEGELTLEAGTLFTVKGEMKTKPLKIVSLPNPNNTTSEISSPTTESKEKKLSKRKLKKI